MCIFSLPLSPRPSPHPSWPSPQPSIWPSSRHQINTLSHNQRRSFVCQVKFNYYVLILSIPQGDYKGKVLGDDFKDDDEIIVIRGEIGTGKTPW